MRARKTPFPPALTRSDGAERRTQVRHACACDASYRSGDHFGTARICDLSAGGVGMLLPRQVTPGGLLTVELRDRVRNSWRLKTLRVVHAAPRSPGMWLVGSAFTKVLTTEELAAILPAASFDSKQAEKHGCSQNQPDHDRDNKVSHEMNPFLAA